ncbi:MAG TPA: 16S rRNA (guanine(527)-N(7))-methyltransferase RsmG [Blastocatellia bacterium]|nr:16S rRNA (guanine(527)-N(7))-methyltransferase RsmG [Blastocatellia bacterium]
MTRDPENEFRVELAIAINALELDPLTDKQIGQLVRHYALLRRWNKRVNLTRIIEPGEAAKLHYAESLFGAKFIAGARTALDIGTGAGFPAIPLAVARPEVQVTALEANQKKSLFLKEAKDELELDNVEIATERLEAFDWEGYDLLTSRALDRAEEILPTIIEKMRSDQRLMLYCARDLVAKLGRRSGWKIETHSIPDSDARLIAIFSSILYFDAATSTTAQ